jgi:hypothetical protein
MDYLANYYKNLAEQLQEKVVILQKAINEAGRPTFIPMTVAYDDSNDPAPNVAALTDEEEEDLRVDRVDNFGGEYPSYGYAQMARSLAHYNDAHLRTNSEMFQHHQQARRDAMEKIHRGRPLRTYGNHTPTAQKANKEFNQAYRFPQELMDRGRGEKVLADISRGILKAHPEHEAFIKAANERAKVD